MFANSFQCGFLSILYSIGSSPLGIWDKYVKNGHIRRIVDDEVKSLVLEIAGTNVATTYITCPIKPRASLGIKLPFLVMVVKNMKKYFTFEIQIIDDKDMRRRFRVSNFQSTTKVRPFCTTMPIGLSSGWNQIQFNLADFTRRAYGTVYVETVRVQIHANVRIRRIYFSDRLYTEDELPSEYKLFLPLAKKDKEKEKPKKSLTIATRPERMTIFPPKPSKMDRGEEKPEEPTRPPPSPMDTVRDIEEQSLRQPSRALSTVSRSRVTTTSTAGAVGDLGRPEDLIEEYEAGEAGDVEATTEATTERTDEGEKPTEIVESQPAMFEEEDYLPAEFEEPLGQGPEIPPIEVEAAPAGEAPPPPPPELDVPPAEELLALAEDIEEEG